MYRGLALGLGLLRLGPAIQAIEAATAPSTSSPDSTLDKPGNPNPSA